MKQQLLAKANFKCYKRIGGKKNKRLMCVCVCVYIYIIEILLQNTIVQRHLFRYYTTVSSPKVSKCGKPIQN